MTRHTPIRLLAHTFFARLFENELLPAVSQTRLVIWILAGLATPGLVMAMRVGGRYNGAAQVSQARMMDAVLSDQVLYVLFSMAALGFIALLTWEGVFPDRRDARILDVLPLPTRTHVAGRLGALAAFALLFSVGINIPGATAYGFALFVFRVTADPLRPMVAHLLSTAMAGLFAFAVFILAQGLLLTLFGRQPARRAALLLQLLFIVVALQALLFAPFVASRVARTFADPAAPYAWLPPAWFVALYDVVAGTRRPVHGGLAQAAMATTAGSMALALALIAASYRRLTRMALEVPDTAARWPARLSAVVSASVMRLLRPGPVPRAVAGFTLRTLVRSRPHLTLVSTYAGTAAALVVATLLPLALEGGVRQPGAAPGVAILALPLLVYFIVLIGLRAAIGIPTELKANWLFRLSAPDDHASAVTSGVRLACGLAVLAPTALVSAAMVLAAWGVRTAAIHLVITALLGLLLLEVLLIGFRKVPFACRYTPGRSRAPTLWPFYLVILANYAYGFAALERRAIQSDRDLAWVLGVLLLTDGTLAGVRQRRQATPQTLLYEEEEPGQLFDGFHLSEGLAARQRS